MTDKKSSKPSYPPPYPPDVDLTPEPLEYPKHVDDGAGGKVVVNGPDEEKAAKHAPKSTDAKAGEKTPDVIVASTSARLEYPKTVEDAAGNQVLVNSTEEERAAKHAGVGIKTERSASPKK